MSARKCSVHETGTMTGHSRLTVTFGAYNWPLLQEMQPPSSTEQYMAGSHGFTGNTYDSCPLGKKKGLPKQWTTKWWKVHTWCGQCNAGILWATPVLCPAEEHTCCFSQCRPLTNELMDLHSPLSLLRTKNPTDTLNPWPALFSLWDKMWTYGILVFGRWKPVLRISVVPRTWRACYLELGSMKSTCWMFS